MIVYYIFLTLSLITLLGCGARRADVLEAQDPYLEPNAIKITVGGSECLENPYVNEICLSITVCTPDKTNCQSVKGILLDTGSIGLRIFQSALNPSLVAALSPVTVMQDTTPEAVGACVVYGDGTSQWGPMVIAVLGLGSYYTSAIPIHMINADFKPSLLPKGCPDTKLDQTPSASRYNGILGLMPYPQDCGETCATQSDMERYFRCSSQECVSTALEADLQAHNPLYFLTENISGYSIILPEVPKAGALSAVGYLTLGLSRTAQAPQNIFPMAKPVYGVALYKNRSMPLLFDTGANTFAFPNLEAIPYCQGNRGFLCPDDDITINFQAYTQQNTFYGLEFLMGNAYTLFDYEGLVVPRLASDFNGIFIAGLPFFFGRKIYFGLKNKTSSLGPGPFIAFD